MNKIKKFSPDSLVRVPLGRIWAVDLLNLSSHISAFFSLPSLSNSYYKLWPMIFGQIDSNGSSTLNLKSFFLSRILLLPPLGCIEGLMQIKY